MRTFRTIFDALAITSVIVVSSIAFVVGVVTITDRLFPEEKKVALCAGDSFIAGQTFFDIKSRKAIRFFPDGTVHLIDLHGATILWETRESFLNWAIEHAIPTKWGNSEPG